jgi:hypothetical protein
MRGGLDPFLLLCRAHRVPVPEREVTFHPVRKWRFDYAWRTARVALEQDGGLWTSGRHVRGRGVEADNEKFAAAVLCGWRVFRASPEQIQNGQALGWVRQALTDGCATRTTEGR